MIKLGFCDGKIILDYLGRHKVITKVLTNDGERQESQRQIQRCYIARCEDKRRSQEPENAGGLWKVEKTREQILPLELPKGKQLC